MARILVTGAAGFIGSHTCDLLLAEGHTVVGVDNFRTGRRENLSTASRHAQFAFEELDILAPGALANLTGRTRPQAIIHLAALVSVPQSLAEPELNFELNVRATQLVAEIARSQGVNRIVFASSAAVYGPVTQLPIHEAVEPRPLSPYGAAKLASEAMLLGHAAAYGLVVRCQRYFNVYGPRQDPRSPYSGVISILHDRLHRRVRPTIYGDGEQTRDFVSVADVARANRIAATEPHLRTGVANICTGTPTSINEIAAVLRRRFPDAPAPEHAAARPGDIRHSVGSPARAQQELGWKATTTLSAGLAEVTS